MKIIVAIKRIVDHKLKVRAKEDGSGVDIQGLPCVINPFCIVALEKAIKLKEAGLADEVVVVSVGSDAVQEQIRHAYAMGADRGIQIATDADLEPIHIATLLSRVLEEEQPNLVFMGKLSVDGDNSQTAPMLASLMDWPLANGAGAVSVEADHVVVTCETDEGQTKVLMPYPAIITSDLTLGKPRMVNLPGLMKAKHRAVERRNADDYGIDCKPHRIVHGYQSPDGFLRNTIYYPSAQDIAGVIANLMGDRL